MDQFNANKPRRLWENREIFTGSAYGVIVVTGPTKTLVPAAVAGLVPRDRGAESELFLDCASLTSFHNFGEPVRVACNGLNTIIRCLRGYLLTGEWEWTSR